MARKGSVSIFLVIVIPAIIISVVALYDALYIRHREEKALKIAYAVSEARLSHYNEYLKKEYSLFAHLENAPLEDFVLEYMDLNGFDSKVVTNSKHLSDPEVFRATVVRSAKGMFAQEALDLIVEKIGLVKIGEKINAKLESINDSFEKISDLMSVPAGIQKMARTSDIGALRQLINSAKNSIYENNSELETLKNIVKREVGDVAELKDDIEKSLSDVTAKYEEQKRMMEGYLSDVEKLLDKIDELADKCAEIVDDIDEKRSRLDELLNSAQSGDGDAEIIRLEEEIAALEEEYETTDKEYLEVKEELDSVKRQGLPEIDRSGFDRLLKTITRAVKKIYDAFKAVNVDGKTLKLGKDHTLLQEAGGDGDISEKIFIAEWCMTVFSCYGKDEQKSDRAIKGELEYLVTGETRETSSMMAVKLKIAGIRAGANTITFMGTDAKKGIDAMFAGIPQPFGAIGTVIAYGAMVLGESYLDAQALLDGESFEFVKPASQWRLDADGKICGVIFSQGGKKLCYKDYLRALIYFEPDGKVLLRAMNLIDASVRNMTQEKYALTDFSVGHSIRMNFGGRSPLGSFESFLTFENSYE